MSSTAISHEVHFTLPEDIAVRARELGLLEQERLERLVRLEVARMGFEERWAAIAALDQNEFPPMSEDEVMDLVKAERRARGQRARND